MYDWLRLAINNRLASTIMTHLVQLSSLPLFDLFYL